METLTRKCVPWYDWNEWESVYSGLYSPSIEERMWAINRVRTWESRGSVPIGAKTAATLVELLMKDFKEIPSDLTDEEKVSCYSLTTIRFVNGILDEKQKQQDYAHSLAGLAVRIGLPLELVSMRHRSTHAQLPDIEDLRDAARTILEWLQENYWVPSCSTPASITTKLEEIFTEYVEMRTPKLRKALLRVGSLDIGRFVTHLVDHLVPPALTGEVIESIPADLSTLWSPLISLLWRTALVKLMDILWKNLNKPLDSAYLSLCSLWFKEIWKLGEMSSLGLSNPFLRGLVIDLLSAKTNRWTESFLPLVLEKGSSRSVMKLRQFVATLRQRMKKEDQPLLSYDHLLTEYERMHSVLPTVAAAAWAPAATWEPCPLGTLKGLKPQLELSVAFNTDLFVSRYVVNVPTPQQEVEDPLPLQSPKRQKLEEEILKPVDKSKIKVLWTKSELLSS